MTTPFLIRTDSFQLITISPALSRPIRGLWNSMTSNSPSVPGRKTLSTGWSKIVRFGFRIVALNIAVSFTYFRLNLRPPQDKEQKAQEAQERDDGQNNLPGGGHIGRAAAEHGTADDLQAFGALHQRPGSAVPLAVIFRRLFLKTA
eukprot:Pompholyxophrys_punicea_v1_NODE_64_length_3937_cov_2.858836.p5 type:complete len:146 gc:universal NODE_64_length_3937_cov_2.858836:1170-1607(+)